jgi:hypothetical protein
MDAQVGVALGVLSEQGLKIRQASLCTRKRQPHVAPRAGCVILNPGIDRHRCTAGLAEVLNTAASSNR